MTAWNKIIDAHYIGMDYTGRYSPFAGHVIEITYHNGMKGHVAFSSKAEAYCYIDKKRKASARNIKNMLDRQHQ
jgi:CRISPR/Cas system CMR-associated protein Cmr5 small subunit